MISNRDYISMDVGQNLDMDSTDSTKAATMAHVGSWFIGNPQYSMVHQHVSSCFHIFPMFQKTSLFLDIFGISHGSS